MAVSIVFMSIWLLSLSFLVAYLYERVGKLEEKNETEDGKEE